ncbi:MAG: SRPBCC family protein [Planctomycetota bacterium]|nr:SRPBCC family protein [Planctomycetota bacterium]
MLLPIAIGLIEGRPPTYQSRSVQTSQIINAPTHQVWDELVFYEEIDREPPWLLKLGLPRPLGTTGTVDRVGAIKKCLYDSGTITKCITEFESRRRLAFEVIEQDIHFEHDVELLGGQFELIIEPHGQTRLTLTTDYRPLVAPRWLWQPIEELAIHQLHEHVLTGISQRVESRGETFTMEHRHDDVDQHH